MTFPKPTTEELIAYYGQPWLVTSNGIVPSTDWERNNIVRFNVPYPMHMGETPITRISVHKKISLKVFDCMRQIRDKFSPIEIKHYGLDEYGGGYNFRQQRGTKGRPSVGKLSLHAYGAAIDLSPTLNPRGKAWNEAAGMLPEEVVDIFTEAGFKWGADFSVADCMHFEATS